MQILVLYTDGDDDEDDDFSDLDASSLDFLRNLDMQVNGSLRCLDNDLDTISGETTLPVLRALLTDYTFAVKTPDQMEHELTGQIIFI